MLHDYFALLAGSCCRLAPLSEGRIDANGTLMCSYHGAQSEEKQCRQQNYQDLSTMAGAA
jgi:phenylpropionate dioxygenase-like ring-hydroxylating dioxygenase large terminal subunit